MSALKQKMVATQALRIAEDIEANQMAAPDLKGRIKKWIQEEVAAAMAKNDDKLMLAINNAVKAEVNVFCNVFSADDGYLAVTAPNDDDDDISIPNAPKLVRQ